MRRAEAIALLVALAASAAGAGERSNRLTVAASVVSSVRLRLGGVPPAAGARPAEVSAPSISVRSVPARGGVYRVTSLQVGVVGHGGAAAMTVRSADSGSETAPLRYAVGGSGGWNGKSFGAALPRDGVALAAGAAANAAVELGFFDSDAQPAAADRYVVLTVLE